MLEIKHTVTEMKNAFDELINRLEIDKWKISKVGNNVNKNV